MDRFGGKNLSLGDWAGLGLREKIGQTMMIKADPAREIQQFGSVREFLARYPVGGIFVCREALAGRDDDAAAIIRAYREASRLPLLVAADVENGCGSLAGGMTTLPTLMALGAANSTDLAHAYGRTIALEAGALGIDWSLSPVADLNLNPLNPITNTRAIGDAAEAAIPLLAAVIRGMRDNGLIATAKHFPGDGVDYRDQHLVTTRNSLSREEWRRNHGAVFAALIEAGVDAVMTGHISLPAYQSGIADGRYLPATLSRELTTRLLKEEMGFGGVVISDALDMGGFLKWYGRARGEVECFKTGTDLLLWPDLGYLDLMERAVASGEVPISRLNDAVSRIAVLKERHHLSGKNNPRQPRRLTTDDRCFSETTGTRVAEGSITLLRDRQGRLPLRQGEVGTALIVAITPEDRAFEEMRLFAREFERYGVRVTLRRNISTVELPAAQEDYEIILYALRSRPHRPVGPLGFSGPEAGSIWASLAGGSGKSIVVSFGSPYHADEYFEAADICINAYALTSASQIATVKALFGEIPFLGRSPVRIGRSSILP